MKVWGCDAYVKKKFHPDKLEPKADKYIFIGHPKQLGAPPISDLEAKVIVSRNGSFLEEKFFSKRIEWEDGGDLMRLLNHHFNQCVAGHRKLFLWHLHQLKWKLMIVIMKLRIKSLPNLVVRQGHVLLQSGTVILSWRSCC